MSCLKDLFTGMRARDVVFMSGYALYLTFGYMSFESPTVLTSLGESGAIVQSLFLVAVIAARMVVYAAMIALGAPVGARVLDGGRPRVRGRCRDRVHRHAHGFSVRRVRAAERAGPVAGGGRFVLRCGRRADQPVVGAFLGYVRFAARVPVRALEQRAQPDRVLRCHAAAGGAHAAGRARCCSSLPWRSAASASPRASPSTRSSPRRCSRARCRCCGVRCLARQSWRS